MDILTMMTQIVTITTDGVNASKYEVKVMDATDSDDLAILKKLRETPSLLLERSLLQALLMIRIQKLKCMTLCLMM